MAEEARMDHQTYGRVVQVNKLFSFLQREIHMNRMCFELNEGVQPHQIDSMLENGEDPYKRDPKTGRAIQNHRRRVPCVWGAPGIGKTDAIKWFKANGYTVIHVPLAQFEEMGDLNGLPQEYQDPETGEWIMRMVAPEWAPSVERHGKKVILLLDDFNRTDPRILKGTMQLIQDYGMVAWQVHEPDWHMMCTANPEGGINDVTPLDPAQVSRFTHITLHVHGEDGARNWAAWAQENDVDDRAITYVLRHPEMIFNPKSDRVNPRTWTQAFDILKLIPHAGPGEKMSKQHTEMLSAHMEACVDKDAANAFMVFMTKGIMELIDPEELLNDLDKVYAKLEGLANPKQGASRKDCLFAIFERLYLYVKSESYQPEVDDAKSQKQAVNFCKLIANKDLQGHDMRWAIMRRLIHGEDEETGKKVKQMLKECRKKDKVTGAALTEMLAESLSLNV